ncbi:MAG: hypothetical protein ACPKQO_09810 [Nitrososphaeraceae archaeon]
MKIVGRGFVWNQYVNLFLEYIFQKVETCLSENFIKLVEKYRKHVVYSDGDTWTHKHTIF